MIQKATLDNLDQLNALEIDCFTYDQIAKRQWRHLLTKANSLTLIATSKNTPLGYATLLFRKNSQIARLYSLAVSPKAQGQGIGRQLLQAIEAVAKKPLIQAETKVNNRPMNQLFIKAGWTKFGISKGYYDDGTDANKYRKKLTHE